MKVALVHDYLHKYGGAERVLEVLHEMFPDSPVYTSIYYPDKMPEQFKSWEIKTSFLQKFPRSMKKLIKPFYHMSFESFDLTQYDLIISSTAGVAKGIVKGPHSIHISYTHTPPKAVWGLKGKEGLLKRIAMWRARKWDFKAAQKVDYFIANSENIKNRIKKFYNRDSEVIYPPIDINKINTFLEHDESKEDYFVMVGRLEGYKGCLEVAQTIKELGLKLKIIGTGPLEEQLKSFGPNVEVLGFLSDEETFKTLQKAKAMIFWAEEDFGMVMAESLVCGTPVIAYGKGGSLEIVNEANGLFFNEQTKEALKKALLDFNLSKFDTNHIIETSKKFSKDNFKAKFIDFINTITNSK